MLTIRRLSRDEAQILIDGAALKAQEIKVPMCIAVTDESGHLVRFDRMDGGKISSISIAIDKAFTGAAARRGTHIYNELCVPGKPTFGIHVTNEGHFSVIGGGPPVWAGGEIVGGIGVSSGSAEQDQLCAEAAIEYFLRQDRDKGIRCSAETSSDRINIEIAVDHMLKQQDLLARNAK